MKTESSIVRRHTRSALPLIALGAFVVLAQALPLERGASAPELRRQMLAAVLNAGAIVLGCCALALPAATLRERRGIGWVGGLHPALRGLALWTGQSSVLVLLGCLLGVAGALLVLLVAGISERPNEAATLRETWDCGPNQPVLVTAGHRFVCEIPAPSLESSAQERLFELRLSPVVRVLEDAAAPDSLRVALALSVRASDGRELAANRVTLLPAAAASISFRVVPRDGPVVLLLRAPHAGLALEFERSSLQLRGGVASVLATTLRALLGLALLAAALGAATLWFSGFVSHPLAVLATLTLLVGLAMSPLEMPDLVGQVRSGAAIGWNELGECALPAVVSAGVCTAFAFRDRRAGGGLA